MLLIPKFIINFYWRRVMPLRAPAINNTIHCVLLEGYFLSLGGSHKCLFLAMLKDSRFVDLIISIKILPSHLLSSNSSDNVSSPYLQFIKSDRSFWSVNLLLACVLFPNHFLIANLSVCV